MDIGFLFTTAPERFGKKKALTGLLKLSKATLESARERVRLSEAVQQSLLQPVKMCRRHLPARCPALALLAQLSLSLLASAMPFIDAGPHVSYEWGEAIRLRHLYTATRQGQNSYFLQISDDGKVEGARRQNAHSLLEMRAVTARAVAIKGFHSALYLCMESDGKLRGQTSYLADDCSFEEQLHADGYNVYMSKKYGLAVSLAKDRHRPHCTGRCFLPLSHFLPMLNAVPLEAKDDGVEEYISPIYKEVNPLHQLESMDLFSGIENSGP